MKNMYLENLKKLREKIKVSSNIENQDVNYVLKWLKRRKSKDKMRSKLINVNQVKDWFRDKNGNLYHKSKQFFEIAGTRTIQAAREVNGWDQLILNQKHGGILAIIMREKRNGVIEFLLLAKKEPGDLDLKLAPSFSATQSNINRVHGGKKTPLTDIIFSKDKGVKLMSKSIHYEEGARFWRKPNQNLLIKIDKKFESKIKGKNFIWLNMSQIKKINLIKGIINPFVKTILFMI
jgi:dTDP-4-dehydro-6-deoxy-alpha-D-glucopyranose 2,3-dehydratase